LVLLDAAVHLPLVLPPVVTGWLLLLAFGAQGPVGRLLADFGVAVMFRWTGAALAAGVMAVPLMVRSMRLSLEAVDPRLEAAARTLGAGPWRVFATITLPLAMPGVLAGLVLGFARSLGEFGATITFVSNIPGETQTLPLAIYSALQTPDGDAVVTRLAVLAVALSLGALVVAEVLARRMRYARGGGSMGFEVDVTLRRGERVIAASFTAGAGITALVGPSGVGKSSVLSMIAGLVRPDAGRIVVDGQVLFDAASGVCLPPERRACGMVFQDHRLFPHLSVRGNLRYGMKGGDLMQMAAFLGIDPLLGRMPRSLSGGEAQRVALGRALLSGPRFLLMDEPLSALDDARRGEVMALIERMRDEFALPILYVSHHGAEVARLADRVIEMM
jgi:molybdate ABC transporter permease protein